MGLLGIGENMQMVPADKTGGLLASASSGAGAGVLPPEMIALVEKIKIMAPDQKLSAIAQLTQAIEMSNKSDQEKRSAIDQLMSNFQDTGM